MRAGPSCGYHSLAVDMLLRGAAPLERRIIGL